jgi:uncharacterized membrane protein YdbT with pleckstrin-like domain
MANTNLDEYEVEFDCINGFKAHLYLLGLSFLTVLVPMILGAVFYDEYSKQIIYFLILNVVMSLFISPLVLWLMHKNQKCRITSTEIQLERGVFTITNKRIPIDKVLQVTITQSCFEKPFGVFRLAIESSASTRVRSEKYLLGAPRNAEQIRDFIMRKRELLRAGINQNTIAINTGAIMSAQQ